MTWPSTARPQSSSSSSAPGPIVGFGLTMGCPHCGQKRASSTTMLLHPEQTATPEPYRTRGRCTRRTRRSRADLPKCTLAARDCGARRVCGSLSPILPSMVFSCAAVVRRKAQLVRKLRPFPALPFELRFSVPNAARRTLLMGSTSLALAILAHAPDAHAQVAVSGDFAVQRFDPAAGPHNYFTTRGARTDGKMVWSAGIVANYSFRPFDVRTCTVDDPADRAAGKTCSDPVASSVRTLKVIENEITGNALGTFTPFPRMQLALNIPVSWVKGRGLDPATGTNTTKGLNSVGVGDAL